MAPGPQTVRSESATSEFPTWTPLSYAEEISDSENDSEYQKSPMVSASLLPESTKVPDIHKEDDIHDSSFSSPPTSMTTLPAHKPRLEFAGVFIPTRSKQSHRSPTTKSSASDSKWDGITKQFSLASALSDAFVQNNSGQNLSDLSTLDTRADQSNHQPKKNSSLQFTQQKSLALHPPNLPKTLDARLGTVEAQLKYPGDQVVKHTTSFLANMRYVNSHGSVNQIIEPQKSGYIINDVGRLVGFVERLESWFGPGDIQRGLGRKPKPPQKTTRVLVGPIVTAEVFSETPTEISEEPQVQYSTLLGKRKRDESAEAEAHKVRRTTPDETVTFDRATEWVHILQRLIKGKVKSSREELSQIDNVMTEIEQAQISAHILETSDLYERMSQLAEMSEVPMGESLRRRAKAMRDIWRAAQEVA